MFVLSKFNNISFLSLHDSLFWLRCCTYDFFSLFCTQKSGLFQSGTWRSGKRLLKDRIKPSDSYDVVMRASDDIFERKMLRVTTIIVSTKPTFPMSSILYVVHSNSPCWSIFLMLYIPNVVHSLCRTFPMSFILYVVHSPCCTFAVSYIFYVVHSPCRTFQCKHVVNLHFLCRIYILEKRCNSHGSKQLPFPSFLLANKYNSDTPPFYMCYENCQLF